jgi:hypothetical protein
MSQSSRSANLPKKYSATAPNGHLFVINHLYKIYGVVIEIYNHTHKLYSHVSVSNESVSVVYCAPPPKKKKKIWKIK